MHAAPTIMCGPEPGAFPRAIWQENGVTRIEIGIPGEARRGILSPEAFAVLKSSAGKADPFLEQALRTGDYAALRAMPPQDQDLTVEPIEETELLAKGSHGEIPVTLYRAAGPPGTRPALVYLHGGGFRMGSRRSTEHSMRLLAQYSSAAVFSVEYRLAPEHRFPCATDDAWNALRWVYRHAAELDVDRARILIGGDSAGGNLAAACARRDRNMRTGILKGQLLVYPVLSQCEPALPGYHFSAGDYEICEEQKQLIQTAVFSLKNTMDGFRLYTKTAAEDRSPDASPLLDGSFSGLPPTWIFCAEFDYLTQQAKAYAAQLAAAGGRVCLTVYRGMHHGFMNRLGQYPQAALLHREMADVLRRSM